MVKLKLTNEELGVLANVVFKYEHNLTMSEVRSFKKMRQTILEAAKDFLQVQYNFKNDLVKLEKKYAEKQDEKTKKEMEKLQEEIIKYNKDNLKKEVEIEIDETEAINFFIFCWNKIKFTFVNNENDSLYREILLNLDDKLLKIYEDNKQ